MRKFLVILGFIAAVLAVVLAVTPLSNIALIPAIVAFILGLAIFYLSKKQNQSKKVVQYIFILTIVSIGITTYKSVFNEVEVGDTEELQERADESVEDSKEILEDLDIEEIDDIDMEELDGLEID
ncbi:FUSC family protein [Meridianimaribacter sp. CL38]|uniref:FUSC family protein n=1 Tax=Meridianimaribacter sp. CL38 TaxID=2213021 RepID=UPI00103F62B6|nr:FUSC family protein [Meridianimaribacter sp. CL38]TBV24776.1 FUSC family protein [Meridianimaribacter sp. CL38]